MSKRVIVGITGASGAIYAKRLIEVLTKNKFSVEVIPSEMGNKVFEYELNTSIAKFVSRFRNVTLYEPTDLFAPPSSGSHRTVGMVVIPCSVGTLGHIANGIISNLLHRAADVTLKERRKLILVVRETPLNRTHIENMLKVTDAGATILPASPAFYNKPKHIGELVDFIVERTLRILTEKTFNFSFDWKGQPL